MSRYVRIEIVGGGYILEAYEDGFMVDKQTARNHDLTKRLLKMLGAEYKKSSIPSKSKIKPSESLPKTKSRKIGKK